MRDFERLVQLAQQAGAYKSTPLAPVQTPNRDSIAASQGDWDDAREKLELRRTSSTYYKDPNKGKVRNLLRTSKKKVALNDRSGWVFTKAERFAEIDQAIRKPGTVRLAQAILTADLTDQLDVNVTYTFDQDGNTVATGAPNGWLDIVAARNEVDYIRLLAAAGASQQVKDKALGVALQRGNTGAVKELLRNKANPNASGFEYFMKAVKDQDMELIKTFLTAIIPLHQNHINDALVASAGRDNPDLVALLFAHGGEGNYDDGHALRNAIASETLEVTATILLHSMDVLSEESLANATETACLISNDTIKQRILEMLLYAGSDPNTPAVQNQLLEAVRAVHPSFVQLLVHHGTSPDQNDAETLRHAIASGQMDLVAVLLQGNISTGSASKALLESKAIDVPEQYEYIVHALVERGVSEDSLQICLADAVDKGCGPALAPMLIERGAILDYNEAQCVRSALKQNNINLLRILLTGTCEPTTLCKVLPFAMAIQDRTDRYHVVSSLIDKGVSGKDLHVALRTNLGDSKDAVDFQLMSYLIQKRASVDFADECGNCVAIAAARKDEKALDTLEAGDPSPDTASAALQVLPVFFAKSESEEYEKTVRMVDLLLRMGAFGVPAAELLIQAVRDDHRGKALDLLLKYRANANYKNGQAIAEALCLPNIHALEQICGRSQLTRDTLATQLPNAMKPNRFDMPKTSLLIQTASRYGYNDVLHQALLEEVQAYGSRKPVIELLLSLKASVDYAEGEALRHAVSKGDVETTRLLLAANPTTQHVARAFPATMQINDLTTRYALMQSLLKNGGPGMGNEALIQASREATPKDLSLVELLIQHKATPDFRDGAPVIEAVNAKNLPLLDLFVRSKLNVITLTHAFNVARTIKCSREERLAIFSTLSRSGFKGFDTSQALLEVLQVDPTDVETSVLLLEYGASVNHQTGSAVQSAAAAGSLQLLDVLLAKKPIQSSRDAAFRAATTSTLDIEQRRNVYVALLETGITPDLVSAALLVATGQAAIDKTLLSLLIGYNASLDFQNGAAVYNVVTKGDFDTVKTILTGTVTEMKTLEFSFSASIALEEEARYEIAKQLLEKKPGVSTSVVSRHLAQVVSQGDHKLLSLLMEYKPEPSYNNGESLVLAARAADALSTAMLVKSKIPKKDLNRAFAAMLDQHAIQKTPGGLETASLLCPLGIEQKLLDRALLNAFDDPINQTTKDLVELLIPYKPDFNGEDGKVFGVAASSGEMELFRRMAAQKPDFDVVIPALITIFSVDMDGWKTEHEGEDEKKEIEEVKEVAQTEEMTEVKTEAKEEQKEEEVISPTAGENVPKQEEEPKLNETNEEKIVRYLQHLEDCGQRGDTPLSDFVLFEAMWNFPKGRLLVKHLLDYGCPANSKTEANVDPSGKLLRVGNPIADEVMTALIWTLTSTEPEISEELALEILLREKDAELEFVTPTSLQSAVSIASAAGRGTVLKRIIEIGIDLTLRDAWKKSPSFYAAGNGHKEGIEILHDAGIRVNDGSLHEAAREGHFEIVELLLANGHRADFPSSLHTYEDVGITALEELCLFSAPREDLNEWKKKMHSCIKKLLPSKGTDVGKSGGKTLLHFALQNSNPLPVTRAILEFPAVWENLNHPVHLYRDNEGYFYSPTKYVEYFVTSASPEVQAQLISLLHANKCDDKYYAHTVQQPAGAVGLPDDIALAVDKQNRADHAYAEEIKRQKEIAERKRAIEAEDYERQIATDKERHELIMRQQREQEASERDIAERKHNMMRSQAQKMERERLTALAEENRIRLQAAREEAAHRQEMREREQAAELNHKRSVAQQEYQALEQRMAMEQRIISEREHAGQVEARRVSEMLEKRKQTAHYEAQQRAASYNNNGY